MALSGESPVVVKLTPIEATPETFREYGQVIQASSARNKFGPDDAQLDLTRGTPRYVTWTWLYIMQLEDEPLRFSGISHHANVTQCLGSAGSHVWYLGVAKPSLVEDPDEIKPGSGKAAVQSRHGHFYIPPSVEDIRVFRISGSKFIKLNRGTWHAGPMFKEDSMDFYNLELTNTNAVDLTTHSFANSNGVTFTFDG